MPAEMQAEIRDAYWAFFDTADLTHRRPGRAGRRRQHAHRRLRRAPTHRTYPAAMKCLLTDREQLTATCGSRPNTTTASGTPTSSNAPSAKPAAAPRLSAGFPARHLLSLAWAVLDRASRGWRGITMTPTGTRLLADLRHQLLDPPTPIRKPDTNTTITDAETVGAVA